MRGLLQRLSCPALLLACTAATAQTPSFDSAIPIGTNQSASIAEASGIVASRHNPNVLWVHNDSGDSARLFAFNPAGALHRICNFTGVSATDWEDIAICTDPASGVDYLYAADIGDNTAVRANISVYRVPEPVVDTNAFNVSSNLAGAQRFVLAYEDGARDAEVLLVDPWTGDIIIVSKRETPSRIYRAAYPQSTNGTNLLVYQGSLTMGWVVGGDISPSGRQVLIKDYSNAYYYTRTNGQAVASAITNIPATVPCATEPQGEAIGWQGRERGYFTLSEGVSQPIYYYASADTDGDSVPDSAEVAAGTTMGTSDSDGDGMADGAELIAGSSPTSSASVFTLSPAGISPTSVTLRWSARTNRTYDVYGTNGSLSNAAPFTRVISNLSVSVDTTVETNMTLTHDSQFYRVQAHRASEW